MPEACPRPDIALEAPDVFARTVIVTVLPFNALIALSAGEVSVSVGATATPNAGEEFVGEVQDQVDSTEGVEVPTDTSTQNTLEVGGITVDDSSVKQIQEEVDGLVEQVNNLDLGDAQMGALSADAAALSDATSQFVSAYNTFQQTGSVETASAVMTSVQNLVAAYSTLQNNLWMPSTWTICPG